MDIEHPTLPYPGPPAGDEDPAPAVPRDDGATWIADSIVAKVAASAAREVDGVASLRGGIPRRGLIRGSERRRGGAMVQVEDDGSVAVAVRLVVLEGFAIPRVIETVRERITDRIAFATGMTVTHVDIGVVDVVPRPAPSPPSQTAPPAPA